MGIVFSNIVAIYRKELQSYFASALAYAIAGVFWLLIGFFFWLMLLSPYGTIQQAALQDLQAQQAGITPPPFDAPYSFLQDFLGVMGWISLFVLPILSMGLYSEERKRGTLELLATSPVTNWAVAIGKLLGVLTFFITLLLPLFIYQAIVLSTSSPAIQPAIPLLANAGLILLAAAVLSLGMFISSLTQSSILAGFLTFTLVLFLLLIELVAQSLNNPVGEALSHFSLLKHYSTLVKGIFDTSSLLVFASYIVLGVFLTAQSIDALRFQRS